MPGSSQACVLPPGTSPPRMKGLGRGSRGQGRPTLDPCPQSSGLVTSGEDRRGPGQRGRQAQGPRVLWEGSVPGSQPHPDTPSASLWCTRAKPEARSPRCMPKNLRLSPTLQAATSRDEEPSPKEAQKPCSTQAPVGPPTCWKYSNMRPPEATQTQGGPA